MNWKIRTFLCILATLAIVIGVVAIVGMRVQRAWNTAWDFESFLRYQVEQGESVEGVPASEALAVGYLEQIFSDNQELLGKLKGVVQRGLDDKPALSLGAVSAMVVTYHRAEDGSTRDVVAHVLGGFPLGKRKPGFHRDGYFRHLVDSDLWNLGNAFISLLGRDMIMFAEEDVANRQQQIVESLFTYGDVMPLVESMKDPLYFTAVFPDPGNMVPIQLRRHVQAAIIKGYLSPRNGRIETVLLTPSSRSAAYALSVISDLKAIAEVSLKTKWNAEPFYPSWSSDVFVDTWWAWEMLKASQDATLEKQFNIVRMRSEFDRVMVNAIVKSIERMGRDMAQMQGSLDERLDPRLVDERLSSRKPVHYWSDAHRWGPNWPFRGMDAAPSEQAAPPGDTVPAPSSETES